MKKLRRLTNDEISDIGSMILKGNLESLTAVSRDKEASVIRVWFASIAVKAISRGDAAALNAVLDRIVGKMKEHVEHSTDNVQVILTLPKNGKEAE